MEIGRCLSRTRGLRLLALLTSPARMGLAQWMEGKPLVARLLHLQPPLLLCRQCPASRNWPLSILDCSLRSLLVWESASSVLLALGFCQAQHLLGLAPIRNHFPDVRKMVFRDDAQTRRFLGGVWNACAGRVDRLLAASTVRFRGLPFLV